MLIKSAERNVLLVVFCAIFDNRMRKSSKISMMVCVGINDFVCWGILTSQKVC